ncbi:metal tolerance protein 2-like [Zingiber officinale]|uniref:metal tolerance protein 2-like n=1 Tax=Zingiber officinale TaxID=94328 RepID=UPI001C4BEBFF|nr:metal tolerance protein 2-like [Zingiber officinale]
MGFRWSNLATIRRSRRLYRHRFPRIDQPSEILSASSPSAVEKGNHLFTALRWHGAGHSHHHHHSDRKGSEGTFRLGLASDVALSVGKGLTGYLTGSTAIIADAAHSVSDIVLSGVAWWSYRAAMAPKDDDHPYGHGKFETLGALGISSMLLVTAGGIAWHSLDVLLGLLTSTPDMTSFSPNVDHHNHGRGGHYHGVDLDHPVLALSMTSISIFVKEGLYWVTKRAGEKEGSELLKANAWHHRSDAVSSIVALIGVGGTILGLPFLDPAAGLLVSGMILKVGFNTGYQSFMELVDAAVDQSVLVPIKQTITQVEGVKGCHRLRGRRAGSFLYLDVHIEVDPFCSVSAAHDIGESVRHQIHKNHSQVAEVFIHIDPSYSYCSILEERKNLKDLEGRDSNSLSRHQEAETIISDILSKQFSKQMSLEHITLHSLQGKILVQALVSMPAEMLISEAMDIAKRAEKEILAATSSINQVSIQLRLGRPISKHHEPVVTKKETEDPQRSNCPRSNVSLS